MREDILTCKILDCPKEGGYTADCIKCYKIRVRCAICGHKHTYEPGDIERGDHIMRLLPIESWMCTKCSAMEIGRSERSIDRTQQTTLDGVII